MLCQLPLPHISKPTEHFIVEECIIAVRVPLYSLYSPHIILDVVVE